MIRQVLTYEVHCDHCRGDHVIVHKRGSSEPNVEELPHGWGEWTTGGWGSTGYTKTEQLCPDCFQEALKKNFGTYRQSTKSPLRALAEQAE